MLKQTFFKLLISFVIATAFVSYFEKQQVNFFMPLRNMLFTKQQIVNDKSVPDIPADMPYKQSKEGFYINPWTASNVVFKTAVSVLQNGSKSVDSHDLQKLIDFAEYFRDKAQIKTVNGRQIAVWPYPIKFSYGVQPGWISGMAQGNAAVLLAAASLCTEEPRASSFREVAKLAVSSFDTDVTDGGVKVNVAGGNWYEEYAQAGISPPLVLNGHIYALTAIEKLKSFDDRANDLYNSGLSALLENIALYDAVTWTYYDKVGTPANNIYQQKLHIRQMYEMYEKTGNKLFLSYYKKICRSVVLALSEKF